MSVESIITENLDIWTSAIKTKSAAGRGSSKKLELYGIKKLRELILDLAVRGKLVQQDQNDEPTSKLIERIKFEQNKLVEEQRIKRQKPLPPISNEEKTFQLPENWEWCRIGSLFNSIVSGGTPSKREPTFWNGDIPWASVKDLGNELFLSKTQDYITQKGLSAGSKLAEKGNLLICTRMGLGKIAIVDVPMAFNQDLKAVAVSKQIDLGFFFNAFKTIKIEGTGTTVAGITQEQLTNYVIALPPYNEQERIVAKIDALMALCDQLESQTEASIEAHQTLVKSLLETLTNAKDADELNESWQRISAHFDVLFTTEDSIDQLKQTILQLAVMGKLVKQDPNAEPASKLLERIAAEKEQLIKDKKIKRQKSLPALKECELPFALPTGWEWARVWDVAHTITSGSRDWAKYYSDHGAIFVTMGNLSRNSYKLRLENIRYVTPPETGEGTRTKLEENDLLISITGDVGNLGLIPPEFGEAYINQHTAMLRLMPECQNRFFAELMRAPLAKYQFDAPQRGIKNSFRLGDVGEMYIPIPPISEQIKIVEKIDHMMMFCDSMIDKLNELQITKQKITDSILTTDF